MASQCRVDHVTSKYKNDEDKKLTLLNTEHNHKLVHFK